MKLILPAMALAVAMFLTWTIMTPVPAVTGGEEDDAKSVEESFDFTGVKKCKICHKTEKSGDQFGIWEKSAHASAYATLATDEAKEIAAKRDLGDPQKAPECLRCHVTAFPVLDNIGEEKITLEEGVSCESCHGPGSGYWKKKTMEAITAGELDAATVGLMLPEPDDCLACHNEDSPTFKAFDYEERWAAIAHPIPAEGD
ncbi:MAG: cytochrome c family protein [Candidatus Eiseniibacteriota bacterium]|jgi:hypothetical protein